MLLLRNIIYLPLIVLFRMIPGTIGIISGYIFEVAVWWQDKVCNKYGIYWKRKGE